MFGLSSIFGGTKKPSIAKKRKFTRKNSRNEVQLSQVRKSLSSGRLILEVRS